MEGENLVGFWRATLWEERGEFDANNIYLIDGSVAPGVNLSVSYVTA